MVITATPASGMQLESLRAGGREVEIVIKSSNVRTEQTTKGTVLNKQQAAMETGRDFPLVFELTVKTPYPPGRYRLSAEAFRVSRFGSLELDPYALKLEPVK